MAKSGSLRSRGMRHDRFQVDESSRCVDAPTTLLFRNLGILDDPFTITSTPANILNKGKGGRGKGDKRQQRWHRQRQRQRQRQTEWNFRRIAPQSWCFANTTETRILLPFPSRPGFCFPFQAGTCANPSCRQHHKYAGCNEVGVPHNDWPSRSIQASSS